MAAQERLIVCFSVYASWVLSIFISRQFWIEVDYIKCCSMVTFIVLIEWECYWKAKNKALIRIIACLT